MTRGVHGSDRVGFVPNLDPTRNFLVGKNRTRNRPGMLVGSAGLGHVGFSGSPVGFGFYRRCRYFDRIVKIWPNHDKISPNLVRSNGFQVNFCRRTLVFVCFHQRTPNIVGSFWLYAQVGLLEFWERKPANRPTDVGFYGR